MLKNAFAAIRGEQQIEMCFDDVRDVKEWWIKGSYEWLNFEYSREKKGMMVFMSATLTY